MLIGNLHNIELFKQWFRMAIIGMSVAYYMNHFFGETLFVEVLSVIFPHTKKQ